MATLMALDVGDKTIGIAFADSDAPLPVPGETILRHEGYRRDMAILRRLIAERNINRILVGMPLRADGTVGERATIVERFVERLRGSVRIPIVRVNEAFTTAEAEAKLDEIGRPKRDQKRTIDSAAACIILQDYLSAENSNRRDNDPK